MGIDIRYYIISLIAIFLALAIGLVAGILLVPSSAMIDQQNAMIASLEDEFKKIKEETRMVRKNLEVNLKFEKEVMPYIISDELIGENIYLINTTLTNKDIYDAIKKSLEMAGAKIAFYISFKEKIKFITEREKEKLKEVIASEENDTNKILQHISSRIADEMLKKNEEKIIPYLKKQGFIETRGNIIDNIQKVVIIGGQESQENYSHIFDVPIIKNFLSSGIKVIGCETTDVKTSYIPIYKKLKITTVDNIETIPGQIALVLSLKGEEGNFGVKETAIRLLPKLKKI